MHDCFLKPALHTQSLETLPVFVGTCSRFSNSHQRLWNHRVQLKLHSFLHRLPMASPTAGSSDVTPIVESAQFPSAHIYHYILFFPSPVCYEKAPRPSWLILFPLWKLPYNFFQPRSSHKIDLFFLLPQICPSSHDKYCEWKYEVVNTLWFQHL